MNHRVLSEEQIKQAKELKEQGKSKRQIAFILGVAQTTVWDNIFNTKKRVRVYKKYLKPVEKRKPCAKCEILMSKQIKGNFVPLNYQVGDICSGCYLDEMNINYVDLLKL